MDKQTVGRHGEDLAASYLSGLGWEVLDRNWRSRLGELDLIARDPDPSLSGTLVFCEVKCRTGLGFGDPLEAITDRKIARLRTLAREWLRAHSIRPELVRLDAIGVLLQGGIAPRITHVRGIES